MRGTRLEHIGGIIRTEQNWIGGNRMNPVGAAFVPPEPEEVPGLLSDLIEFVNSSELPPVAIAAIAHAQFETIHPFADGNGRTGRALIHAILHASITPRATIPPVSLALAADRNRYIQNLSIYRTDEEADRQAAVNEWVEYFANALSESCRRAIDFEQSIEAVKTRWRETTGFRKN